MKSQFFGHFKPSESSIKEMWKSSLIVFDTNVLLHLYRYSEETREQLFAMISAFKDRIWIPHKVAYEFFDNRLDVLGKQIHEYDSLSRTLDNVENDLGNIRQHPFVDQGTFARVKRLFGQLKKELATNKNRLLSRSTDDEILQRIGELFDGEVGESFSQKQLDEIYVEGANRFGRKVPPGFKDATSKASSGDNYRIYGDLILWKQILTKAADAKRNVIFVSDDKKEDWWLEFQGRKISPLPVLLQEFHEITQKTLFMYTVEKFIEYAGEFLKRQVSSSVIEEARDVRETTKAESESLSVRLKRASLRVENRLKRRKKNRASFIAIREEVNENYTDEFLSKLIAKYPAIFRAVQVKRTGQFVPGITLVTSETNNQP